MFACLFGKGRIMLNWKLMLGALAACMMLTLGACGDDSSDAADTGPAGDGDGDGDTTPDGDLCGGETCVAGILGDPCCTTQADIDATSALSVDMCGLDLTALMFEGCVELDQPGDDDASCPEVEAMGMQLPACCTTTGMCGQRIDLLGLGCVPNINMVEQACPGEVDAGGSDAGQ